MGWFQSRKAFQALHSEIDELRKQNEQLLKDNRGYVNDIGNQQKTVVQLEAELRSFRTAAMAHGLERERFTELQIPARVIGERRDSQLQAAVVDPLRAAYKMVHDLYQQLGGTAEGPSLTDCVAYVTDQLSRLRSHSVVLTEIARLVCFGRDHVIDTNRVWQIVTEKNVLDAVLDLVPVECTSTTADQDGEQIEAQESDVKWRSIYHAFYGPESFPEFEEILKYLRERAVELGVLRDVVVSQKKEFTATSAELADVRERVNGLEQIRVDLIQQRDGAREREELAKARTGESNALFEQLSNSKSMIQDLSSRVEQLDAQVAMLNRQNECLIVERNTLQKNLDHLTVAHNQLAADHNSQYGQLHNTTEELVGQRFNMQQMQLQLNDAQLAKADAEGRLEKYRRLVKDRLFPMYESFIDGMNDAIAAELIANASTTPGKNDLRVIFDP